MKKLALTISLLVSVACLQAQEYVATVFNLSRVAMDTSGIGVKDQGVIMLDENDNHFRVTVPLGTLLNADHHEVDSIRDLHEHIVLDFKGIFPFPRLSSYEIEDDKTVYTMEGSLRINGITHPYTMRFELHLIQSTVVDPRDMFGYPARISFDIEFNPADYNLDLEVAKYTEYIRVSTATGIINRVSHHFSLKKHEETKPKVSGAKD